MNVPDSSTRTVTYCVERERKTTEDTVEADDIVEGENMLFFYDNDQVVAVMHTDTVEEVWIRS